MTRQAWVALLDMAHSFIELHKPLHHDKVAIHEGKKWTEKFVVQDRGVCCAAVHKVAKSETHLSD